MFSFKQFLAESSTPFGTFPGVTAVSLEKFAQQPSVQTEQDEPFGLGATTRTPDDAEMQGYLRRIFDQEKTKADKVLMPYIHRSLLKKVEGRSFLLHPGSTVGLDTQSGNTFNIGELKRQMTVRPKEILSQNRKMQKSSGMDAVYYNFGIPALVGLAVNQQTNDFVVVSTCPGAGQCQTYCYAMKGGYVQYVETSLKQTRMLNFLLNDPQGFFAQLKTEIANAVRKYGKQNKKVVVRWHDAGDFFSNDYKKMFYDVVSTFPDVLFYAYTKIANIATGETPDNLVMNFSQGAKPSERQQVDIGTQKHSSVVPKDMFSDLMVRVRRTDDETGENVSSLEFKGPSEFNTFKQRLAAKYNIDPKTIITYQEMLKLPLGRPNQYNVFVVPGEGDVSASRRDVQGTFLLFH